MGIHAELSAIRTIMERQLQAQGTGFRLSNPFSIPEEGDESVYLPDERAEYAQDNRKRAFERLSGRKLGDWEDPPADYEPTLQELQELTDWP